jgi:hypothetical protein
MACLRIGNAFPAKEIYVKTHIALFIGGGPFDGTSCIIHEDHDELRMPYTKEILRAQDAVGEGGSHRLWENVEFPSEDESDGVAVYRRHEPVPRKGPDGSIWCGLPRMYYKFDRCE